MANLSSTRIFGDGTVERSLYVKQRLGVGVGNPSAKVQAQSSGTIGGSGNLSNANFLSGNTSTGIGIDNNEITKNGGDLYLSATSGNIQFRTNNGNERMRIESGGNVGIGTTSPEHQLTVEGNNAVASLDGVDTNGTPMLHIGEQDNFGVGFRWDSGLNLDIVQFDGETITNSGGTKVGHFRVRDKVFYWSGSVGIGTTSPSYAVDVNGTGNFSGDLYAGGQVGIGTTLPDDKLDVHGNISAYDTNFGRTIRLRTSGGRGQILEALSNSNSNADIEFYIDNDPKAVIRANGNVGIGTSSPGARLDVNGQVEAQDYYIREDNLWLGDHVDNDDAHHPDHRDGIAYIDFDNNEQSDYNTDGRLYWDLSAGLYIKSSNIGDSNPRLLWSGANVSSGSGISIGYGGEDEPTIDTRVNHTISTNAPSGGSDGDVWFVV